MRASQADLDEFLVTDETIVAIKISSTLGSTPRDDNTWMLVTESRIFGTIGGGQLELLALEKARDLTKDDAIDQSELQISLGPHSGQCCGGVVHLDLRVLDASGRNEYHELFLTALNSEPDIYIFGAGHVGRALAESLALLPVNSLLIDNRKEEIDKVGPNIKTSLIAIPEELVRSAKPGSAYIILTHDHALDFLITREALMREDASYVGMIGSKTKRATFKNWLKREQSDSTLIERLTCPIGNTEIKDKRPEIIAAFVTAELLEALNKESSSSLTLGSKASQARP